MSGIYDFSAKTSAGEELSLRDYAGKVLLIVNVASKCGYTPQYEGLEALYQRYKDRGLEILGFPCNQFLNQEPGSAEDIQSFCSLNYGVSFPVLAKIEVNGPDTAPLYTHLKKAAPGILGTQAIKWNFTKFLVGRDGKSVTRFATATKPEEMVSAIEAALGQG
ncbi:MAG: glutathione peroxidase [Gammaproteobacteria bacterium]|nr:glutathione peroxidase [Gammaproteobacteria bacterium]